MINILFLLCLFSLSLGHLEDTSSCSSSFIPGAFTWSNGGVTNNSYIIQAGGSNSWGPVSTSGSTVTSGIGPRYYLANSCASSFGPSVFQKINPLGATISFTVNLGSVGCGVNAAFYLVGMPASSSGSNGDYYCDGNCVGSCCTEMDLMEANRHALQITPHRCTGLTSGCDGNGCARNTQSINNGYGPSSAYKINTQNTFNVSITFHTTSGQLSTIVSVISQGSNSITLTHDSSCGSGYLSGLDQAFSNGMVAVWSFWSGSMSWLDSPACSSDTNEMSNSNFIFSNLKVTGAGTITSPPPSPPASQHCGSNGCTTNLNWVEFTTPSGVAATSASVTCSSVSCSSACTNNVNYPCTWFASGNKYQCPCSSNCYNPIPMLNGQACPTSTSSALPEETAQSNSYLDTATIAGIVVGCVVGVILLVTIIVVVVMKKKKTEEFV